MKNNQDRQKLVENYAQQKANFLDNLQPDDFRNGGSFNQAEFIIDELNKALRKAVVKGENADEFIKKAVGHLFREGSAAAGQAVELAKVYLQSVSV
jgi:hypothetical protein